jgi:hypothetical protein
MILGKLAMTTPTHIASIDRGQPTEASAKRKREIEAPSDIEKLVDRKYDLDLDILECPVCSEPFSPPVYQVPSHIVLSLLTLSVHCVFSVDDEQIKVVRFPSKVDSFHPPISFWVLVQVDYPLYGVDLQNRLS